MCGGSKIGDWFLLYQLGKNIDPVIYREFMEKLYLRMYDSKEAEAYNSGH